MLATVLIMLATVLFVGNVLFILTTYLHVGRCSYYIGHCSVFVGHCSLYVDHFLLLLALASYITAFIGYCYGLYQPALHQCLHCPMLCYYLYWPVPSYCFFGQCCYWLYLPVLRYCLYLFSSFLSILVCYNALLL